MNIAAKISRALHVGGIVITSCFGIAIIAGLFGMPFARLLALFGVAVTAATPVAGVIIAAIYLRKAGETKHFIYAIILLLMMLLAGIWRLIN